MRLCGSPTWSPVRTPLAGVEDVFNAIAVTGNAVGDVMFYGRGAGKLPTASAVVADVIDIAKDTKRDHHNQWGPRRPRPGGVPRRPHLPVVRPGPDHHGSGPAGLRGDSAPGPRRRSPPERPPSSPPP